MTESIAIAGAKIPVRAHLSKCIRFSAHTLGVAARSTSRVAMRSETINNGETNEEYYARL
jgi:hypothetical protein